MNKWHLKLIRSILLVIESSDDRVTIQEVINRLSSFNGFQKIKDKLGAEQTLKYIPLFIDELANNGCLNEVKFKTTKDAPRNYFNQYSITFKGLALADYLSDSAKAKRIISKGVSSVPDILKFAAGLFL